MFHFQSLSNHHINITHSSIRTHTRNHLPPPLSFLNYYFIILHPLTKVNTHILFTAIHTIAMYTQLTTRPFSYPSKMSPQPSHLCFDTSSLTTLLLRHSYHYFMLANTIALIIICTRLHSRIHLKT